MPEYLSPGVYVEEIDAGPRPIAGVSTSTAGMVGVTRRGPEAGKPRLVTNFLEFQSIFGGFVEPPAGDAAAPWGAKWWRFPEAVKGFFDNGGQRVYVKRVVSTAATAASGKLTSGLTTEIVQNAAPGATKVEVRGLLGFAGNEDVTIHDGSTGAPIGNGRITSYVTGAQTVVTLKDPLTAGVRADRGDYLRAGGLGADPTLTFTAASRGAWGRGLQVRVRPVAGAQLPLLADPGEGHLFASRLAADIADPAAKVKLDAASGLDGDLPADVWVVIDGNRYQATERELDDAGAALFKLEPAPDAGWKKGLPVQRVRRSTTAAGPKVRLGGAGRLYDGALLQFDDGKALTLRKVSGSPTGDLVTLGNDLPAGYFEGQRAYLVEAEVTVRLTDDAGGAATTETFTGLHWGVEDPSGVVRAVTARSQFVAVTSAGDLVAGGPVAFPGGELAWTTLDTDGADGFEGLAPADFIGGTDPNAPRTGIDALEQIDEVAICAVPGVWSDTVQQALIGHCELLRDRFAVLDPADGLGIDEIQDFRAPYDTKYAALYYPWIVATNPVTGLPANLPPSGHIAGIYARVDVERGVHKAPANAVVRGADLRDGLARDITRRQQDQLNPKGINALRYFPGMGNRVWGARTLSSDSSWKYVNVRRLFLFLEESIDEGTQWVVFEPNAEPLWALVKQTVENFLGTVWRSGALAGTTPDEAFFVACDRTTMTEDDLANGRLICVIGVAPVFPAEFVIFRIQQKTRETTSV